MSPVPDNTIIVFSEGIYLLLHYTLCQRKRIASIISHAFSYLHILYDNTKNNDKGQIKA